MSKQSLSPDFNMNCFLTLIKSLPPQKSNLHLIINKINDYSLIFPRKSIYIKNKIIFCEDTSLNLEKKHKILNVFSIFLNNNKLRLNINDLITSIYGISPQDEISLRRRECLNHNIVKLISRARKLATKNLILKNYGKINWFPYDPQNKTWTLVDFSYTL